MLHSNYPKEIGSVKMKGEVWMEIRNDRQKGLSYTEIARKYHIDPRTAKKYAESEIKPVYNLSNPKPSKLDPYKEQIRLWLEEAPYLVKAWLFHSLCPFGQRFVFKPAFPLSRKKFIFAGTLVSESLKKSKNRALREATA